ncbi:MAG: response regulator [Flavobacteriales bacterium]|nr:response regulator [Flavobacteriales bacterium]
MKPHTIKYAFWGAAFGICFPLIATFFELWMSDVSLSIANVIHAHSTQPLLWIIDSAPFILGIVASFAGKKQDKLQELNTHQESIIREKTESLQKRNMILENEIELRKRISVELEAAKIEADSARQAEEKFLANMSHEIRTPLNGIVGFTRLMLDTEIDDQQQEYLQSVMRTSNHLVAIINDILELSKIKAGQIDFEMRPICSNEFFAGVMNTLILAGKDKGLSMNVSLHTSLPEAFIGDTTRLSQVLLNLINNAIKFTSKGSVTLSARMFDADFGTRLRLEVQDTGIGIPADKLESIFNDFQQAESSTTRLYGGTGLGLTISKKIIELLGGKIGVDSTLGEGSVFWVEIPCAACDRPESHAEVIRNQAEPKSLNAKILLAEDNEMNRLLAKSVFEKWTQDVEIDYAFNGKEAIEMLMEKDYDIILMDLQMPEMDGFTATRFIRTEMEAPKRDIPIIALTADVMSVERKKAFAVGMNRYITKPFKPEELISEICLCIERA